MARITVIGSFVMDNVAKMDKFPEAGQSVLGNDLELFPGGKGANQCVAIARLGGDVEMVGMLGNDANGETFRKILHTENIKSDHVFCCNKSTAVAQVQIDASGQNRICVIPSSNYAFGFDDLERVDSVLQNTELVVLQLEMRLDVTAEIIRRAHRYGVKVLLNPAPAVKLEPSVLAAVDYLTPNETELSILTDMPTDTNPDVIAAAKALLKSGVKNIIATLGRRGALIVNAEQCEIVDGYRVKAVDTVAAGDSFNGALAVALTEGKTLPQAVRFANAMGALTVQKNGAIPSLHTRMQLEDFMRAHGTP